MALTLGGGLVALWRDWGRQGITVTVGGGQYIVLRWGEYIAGRGGSCGCYRNGGECLNEIGL